MQFSLSLPNDTEYPYEVNSYNITPGQTARVNCRNDDAQEGFPSEVEFELPPDLVLVACWVNSCSMTEADMASLTTAEEARVANALLNQDREDFF